MTARELLNIDGVCAKLSVSKDWFFRHNKSLVELKGFPGPVPGFEAGSGRRWDPAAIDAWLDLQMAPALREAHVARAAADAGDRKDWGAIGRQNAEAIARDLAAGREAAE